jgi:hypothetical protein
MNYDPLAELIQVAEDCCADHGQLSKVAALQKSANSAASKSRIEP